MRTVLKFFFIFVFFIHQSSMGVAAASGPVCTGCVPAETQVGDKVRIGQQNYNIVSKEHVAGRTVFGGIEVGSGPGSGVYETPAGRSHAGGDGASGKNGANGNVRFTGKDFSNFEDDEKASKQERARIAREQALIVDRINRETIADAKITGNDLRYDITLLQRMNDQAIKDASTFEALEVKSQNPLFAAVSAAAIDNAQVGDLTLYYAGWKFVEPRPFRSDQAPKLESLRNRLVSSVPRSPQQVAASRAGHEVLVQADDSYLANERQEGDALVGIAEFLIDVATDLNPVTSIPKDSYRAYVGKDPITGEPLANWERVVALGMVLATVSTAGGSNFLTAPARAAGKAAKLTSAELASVIRIGSTATDTFASQRFIQRAKELLTDIQHLDPIKENAILKTERGYTENAWAENRVMISGKLKKTENFVRVYGENARKEGSWIVDPKYIEGKSPAEIQALLALEQAPSMTVSVVLPKDTQVYAGFIQPNAFGGDVSIIQYFIPIPDRHWFGPGENIAGFLK